MNCEKMETRLIGYFDGKASASVRREVEAHLAACAACRVRAEEFRALDALLEELPSVEPAPSFDARVRARVAAEPRRAWLWAWLEPSPRFAVSAALLLMLAIWVGTRPLEAPAEAKLTPDAEFSMIKDLPVLENYDVLANFDALDALPAKRPAEKAKM